MCKRLLVVILLIATCLLTTACNDKKNEETKSKSVAAKYDFSQSTLNINRPKREQTKPMGEEGTWTIFVYMCGSDLESRAGAASKDIDEMISSTTSDKVKFVVETGGSVKWQNGASSQKLQRYEICSGKVEMVDETANASMGLDTTLADFLDWGIDNYPAANMGLILWDHGGGSVNGVCLDEQFESDSLLLRELDAALYSVYHKMTEPFEFIGFDACLMSSVETASLLSTHANYMIASEETEPGTGWDYVSIGNFLGKNPRVNGEKLGQEVCDSFYDSCEQRGLSKGITMSVIDLRNIDALLNGFDIFAKDVYDTTTDSEKIASFFRNMYYTDRYGSNGILSGYSNMADLGGLINAGSEFSNISEDLTSALNDCIVYKKNGLSHSNSSGLSIYYPFGINIFSVDEMNIFKDIAISSYYLGIVDKVVHGSIDPDISGYDNGDILQMFLSDWSDSSYSSSGSHYSYSLSSSSMWSYTQGHNYTGQSSALSLSTEPQLSGGHYSFTISSDTLHNAEHVQSSVYYWLEGNTEMFELGETGDVNADFSNGKISDNFDGKWFALPDGQVLSVYLMETSDESDIYYTPILLNNTQTNLRFIYNRKDKKAEMLDICDNISENGMSARSRYLEKGDKIKPIHYIKNKYNEKEKNYYGKEYIYSGDNKLTFAMLPEGEYWYSFRISDIFGDWLETEPICFNVNSGSDHIEFKEEHHKWLPATCLTPKTCAFCGATEGEAAGHNWKEATCTEPKICTVCGETEGKAAGHKWTDATFSEPKTCEICGETSGEPINVPIGSGYSDYTVLDVDNDGEDELVEVYRLGEGFDLHHDYRIYDSADSYYDITVCTNGGTEGQCDAVVYNGNTGRIEIWCLGYHTHGELWFDFRRVSTDSSVQTLVSAYDSFNPDKSNYEDVEYRKNGTGWLREGEAISKNGFIDYLNNISVLFSNSDAKSIITQAKSWNGGLL